MRVLIVVVIMVAVGISVGSQGQGTRQETQSSHGQDVWSQAAGRSRSCGVGRLGASGIVRASPVCGLSS